jgi:addiction module HigA family antidote
MIQSFGSKETEKIWEGFRSKKLPDDIQHIARRKLRMLNNSVSLNDLIVPPSNKLEKLENIHPGEILIEEFLIPLKISSYKLSKDLNIPQTRISEIIKGKRRITADSALRLSNYFGNTAKFWLGLQDDYDIEEEILLKKDEFKIIKKFKENVV